MAQTLRSATRFTHGLAQMFEVAVDKERVSLTLLDRPAAGAITTRTTRRNALCDR
jgi:ABC-type uncharacterized transport system ATPase subunit